MPQLMPLPWVLSFSMVFLFIFILGIIYSDFNPKLDVESKLKDKLSLMWSW